MVVAQGRSYREAPHGLGRSDLIINIGNQETVIESKIYYDATQYKKGKKQLAHYCQSLGLSIGLYLVFLESGTRLPNYVKEGEETIHGVIVRTFLVMYDEEKDF
ncbi:MAG: hypothetical protein HC880_04860 [Bacteroidia bacterium]|nr:hypothetical protein [Bacteroidia bacterium]